MGLKAVVIVVVVAKKKNTGKTQERMMNQLLQRMLVRKRRKLSRGSRQGWPNNGDMVRGCLRGRSRGVERDIGDIIYFLITLIILIIILTRGSSFCLGCGDCHRHKEAISSRQQTTYEQHLFLWSVESVRAVVVPEVIARWNERMT
jgi:hypothetical protein